MKTHYTSHELCEEIKSLKNTFEVVRVVDSRTKSVYEFDEDGSRGKVGNCECYRFWEKGSACFYCVSARALLNRSIEMKIEFKGEQPYIVFAKYVNVDGREFALEITTPALTDAILGSDGISKYASLINHYNDALFKDTLTGVYNRRFLMEKLPLLLRAETASAGRKVGVAYFDVDRLKYVNDTYGHLAGDQLLTAVAGLIRSEISERRGDFISRIGGDEFVIVFNGIEPNRFRQRLETIERSVADHDFRDIIRDAADGLRVTISVGGVLSDELPPGAETRDYLSLADDRLYQSKRAKHETENF